MNIQRLLLAHCLAFAAFGHLIGQTITRDVFPSPSLKSGAVDYLRPVAFIENRGQWKNASQYCLRRDGLNVWIDRDQMLFDAYRTEGLSSLAASFVAEPNALQPNARRADIPINRIGHVLRARWVGMGTAVNPIGIERASGSLNFLNGSDSATWTTSVPFYGGLRFEPTSRDYRLTYFALDTALLARWNFERSPAELSLQCSGYDDAHLSEAGDLVFTTAVGTLIYARPRAYLIGGEDRIELMVAWSIGSEGTFELDIPSNAGEGKVVVEQLIYSTYVRGSYGKDWCNAVYATDAGETYLTGHTLSKYDFPTTEGAYQRALNREEDAFVLKFDADGDSLIFGTLIGDDGTDVATDIAVDFDGNVVVCGYTRSAEFPTTDPSFHLGLYEEDHGFITKLNPVGSRLVYSRLFTRTKVKAKRTRFLAIAVDQTGNAYATGYTTDSTFPATPNGFDGDINDGGNSDAVLIKINPWGDSILYATYLGGARSDMGEDVAVGFGGEMYVAGTTGSIDFPTTSGAIDSTLNESYDLFITKLRPAGDSLVFSTYLGSSGSDAIPSITLNGQGDVYLTATTDNSMGDFPTTAEVFDPDGAGNADVVVVAIDGTKGHLIFSTLVGGSLADVPAAIAVDRNGYAHVIGHTFSRDFPITPSALDRDFGSPSHLTDRADLFLVTVASDGSDLLYGTYLGGPDDDRATDLVIDSEGLLYATGVVGTEFPTTEGSFDPFRLNPGSVFFKLVPARSSGMAITRGEATFLALSGPRPNPFSTGTQVGFTPVRVGHGQVRVVGLDGRTIAHLADTTYGPGEQIVYWDGTDDAGLPAPSGFYLFVLKTELETVSWLIELLR